MKNKLIILCCVVIVFLFIGCKVSVEDFSWHKYDGDLFRKYLFTHEDDFINVYNILKEREKTSILEKDNTGEKIVLSGYRDINFEFSPNEVAIIKKVFETHNISTVKCTNDYIKFRSPHIGDGYIFFTYYEYALNNREGDLQNWVITFMSDYSYSE